MRIILLTRLLGKDSGGRQILDFARRWQDRWTVGLALLEHRGASLDDVPAGLPVTALPGEIPADSQGQLVWALQAIPALRSLIRRERPDAILSFLWLPTVLAALAVRGLSSRPALCWSIHGDLEEDFPLQREGWLRRATVREVLIGGVDRMIATSSAIRSNTAHLLGVGEDALTVIPDGIDVNGIRRLARERGGVPPADGRFRIVSSGPLRPETGCDVLIRAVGHAQREEPVFDCRILGDGPERPRLEELVRELTLQDVVHFEGNVGNPHPWVRSADLVVSTSRAERLDRAVLEAMVISRAVILPAWGSAQDLLAPGVDSEVVHSDDPEILAAAILRLVHDPVLRRDFRRNALRTASRFDIARVAERYREELEALVVGGVRPPAYCPLPVLPERILHS